MEPAARARRDALSPPRAPGQPSVAPAPERMLFWRLPEARLICRAMRGRPVTAGGRLLVLSAVVVAAVALGPGAESAHATKVTFIGDSKAAGIELSARAKRLLARGHDMRRDLKVCRRLVAQSCVYHGVRPRTALQAIQFYGTSLGRVLVIDVGYNDSSATYRRHLNMVMLAALTRGVKGVVWVNLKTVRPDYRKINRIINRAKSRWARLYVANWNKWSRGKSSWFTSSDGIHLTEAGAVGLVKLVRAWIPRAAQGPRPGTVAAQAGFDYPGSSGTYADIDLGSLQPASAESARVANSPPVGSNLVGPSGSAPGGLIAFAGGAALMLFLIFVTVKRRRTA